MQRITGDSVVGRRRADRLVKIMSCGGHEVWLLLHIEVQGRADACFPGRKVRKAEIIALLYRYRTLHEAAAVVAPAEPALLAALQASDLLHADETSWPQHEQSRWLWVFISATTVRYLIADRGKATVTRVLAGFDGWLMNDGWF